MEEQIRALREVLLGKSGEILPKLLEHWT